MSGSQGGTMTFAGSTRSSASWLNGRCGSFVALSLVSGAPARAQSSTATLTGSVVDDSAAALPEASVTALNGETGQRRQVISGKDGTFTIPLLPPGRYTVTAVRQGFSPTEITDIVLNVNDERTLRIQLRIGQIEAAVVVRAEASQVD